MPASGWGLRARRSTLRTGVGHWPRTVHSRSHDAPCAGGRMGRWIYHSLLEYPTALRSACPSGRAFARTAPHCIALHCMRRLERADAVPNRRRPAGVVVQNQSYSRSYAVHHPLLPLASRAHIRSITSPATPPLVVLILVLGQSSHGCFRLLLSAP